MKPFKIKLPLLQNLSMIASKYIPIFYDWTYLACIYVLIFFDLIKQLKLVTKPETSIIMLLHYFGINCTFMQIWRYNTDQIKYWASCLMSNDDIN